MSSLPFRPESLVTKAMSDAESKAKLQLVEAVTGFFEKVKQLTYDAKVQTHYDGFTKHREAVARSLGAFDEKLGILRIAVTRAFEEYDVNAREIDAWLTAARAGDRVAKAASR